MIMRKSLFICFLFISLKALSSSPNYSVTPGTTLEDTAGFNTLSIYDIYQVNISQSTIQLKWNLISINIPQGWDYSICELGTCYPGIPNGGTMDSVVPGDMGFLGLNINPFFIQGTAVVKVFVYENGYYSQGDTLTWIIHALTTSYNEFKFDDEIKLYPNPTAEILNILLPYKEFAWTIFDFSGKKIRNGFSMKENEVISVSDLKEGRYFILITAQAHNPRRIAFQKVIE
jgi:hypothetical protein